MAAELVEPDVDRFSQQDAGGHPVGVGSKGCGGITAVTFAKERHRRWPGTSQISAVLFFGEGDGNLHLGHHLLRQPCRPVLNDIRNLLGQVVRVLLRRPSQQLRQRFAMLSQWLHLSSEFHDQAAIIKA